MATRIADLEREVVKEQKQAARWVEKNGVGSLPGRRADNGESDVRERSSLFSGTTGVRICLCDHRFVDHDEKTLACLVCSDCTAAEWDAEKSASSRRRVVSYDQHDTVDDWEQHLLKTKTRYVPLVGHAEHLGPREIETRARVQHVLSFLLPMHVELLLMRHVEQLKMEDMGAELACSYQAVQQRLAVAEQDFHREWVRHADDPLDWKDAL